MCHVLVIEDEPLIAEIICDFLTCEGARSFDVAASEAQAICMADAHPPTVITSDVRIKGGRGPHAVEAIRAAHGALPTIFITALADECEPCDHAVAILTKPFSYDDLATAFSLAKEASPNP
ncbi:response regulator [Sphingomonas sp. RHCKR47]|uniref:response regulator n=1 Tax=Sphingomonas citricola TaxID=2862498 RepID=UPI001CA519D6|nr:response regulator [Sphingomonas citricola]MBW6522726.1 response regulator [Sphingomonas citricola]